MKKLFLLAALCVAAAFSSCSKHDNEIDHVEPPVLPDEPTRELAITFAEGNSLEFDVDETKTVHYTITGGGVGNVVKAEMQTPDDAYTVKTTPASATEGTIAITAKTPETENCVIVTVSDGSQTIMAAIAVSTKPAPEELVITFTEGNSLEFSVNETKTVHYTITGGSENTVVTAELQTPNDTYIVETTPTSATEGTIAITAKTPETENCVVVSVSDGSQTVMAEIVVSTKPGSKGNTITVETPGTLSQLLADYDRTTITELTVIGNLNDEDIVMLNYLPNLAILDMEHVNLEELPVEAFKDKTSLTSVKLPKTLKTIGNYAFYGCSDLTSVTIPDSVTTIGSNAFRDCSSLTSITIPDSVTIIKFDAFSYCSSLTSVTIGNGVKSIGSAIFAHCESLTSITIPDSVTSIGDSAFSYCISLTSITIPDSVKEIGDGAFGACKSLTSITIPDGVEYIHRKTFAACSSLTSITIPDSVTKIYEEAFHGCTGLKSMTIGSSVEVIWGPAFSNCTSLTRIYCKAIAPPSIATYSLETEQPFYNVNTDNVTLYVPVGSGYIYRTAKTWGDFSNIIEMEF